MQGRDRSAHEALPGPEGLTQEDYPWISEKATRFRSFLAAGQQFLLMLFRRVAPDAELLVEPHGACVERRD
jgi:hypothetical protein